MGKTVRQPFVRRGSSRLEHGFLLWRLLHRHRSWLTKDDQAWGTVGYTLTSMRRRRAVVKWLASWRDRPNAEPWMLSNLVVALRNLGRLIVASVFSANHEGAKTRRNTQPQWLLGPEPEDSSLSR